MVKAEPLMVFDDLDLGTPRVFDKCEFKKTGNLTYRIKDFDARGFKRRHLGIEVLKGKSNMVDTASDTGTGRFALKKDNVGITNLAGIRASVIGASHVCHVPLFCFRP